jgi:hypothetical protein
LQSYLSVHGRALRWLIAIASAFALSLATGVAAHAEESNPNNYECHGHIEAGQPEVGNEEPQVAYEFYCDGPITGYQIESNVEINGAEGSPNVTTYNELPTSDTFSCSSEIPGWAVNCVGATTYFFERVTGQFTIESEVCAEPRVDPLLTVTYAYLEKGVVTQAIAGPFELRRPVGCKPDAYSKLRRLAPEVLPTIESKDKGKKQGKKGSKGKAKDGDGGKGKAGSGSKAGAKSKAKAKSGGRSKS